MAPASATPEPVHDWRDGVFGTSTVPMERLERHPLMSISGFLALAGLFVLAVGSGMTRSFDGFCALLCASAIASVIASRRAARSGLVGLQYLPLAVGLAGIALLAGELRALARDVSNWWEYGNVASFDLGNTVTVIGACLAAAAGSMATATRRRNARPMDVPGVPARAFGLDLVAGAIGALLGFALWLASGETDAPGLGILATLGGPLVAIELWHTARRGVLAR